jgi:acetyl-CoA C-acetyltransferase
MAETFGEAMRCAGVGVDDIGHLDLYSCFASSVFFALDALGLTARDPRSLTQTGGLPFAGGAASNYMGHSIASMAATLRGDPDSVGLVSGVGMHMTKHVAGIYSTQPGAPTLPGSPPPEPPTVDIVEHFDGPATIAAYSVVHGRSGEPEWALLVCDVDDRRRCYARVDGDGDLLAALEGAEWVGRTVTVRADGDVNRASRRS